MLEVVRELRLCFKIVDTIGRFQSAQMVAGSLLDAVRCRILISKSGIASRRFLHEVSSVRISANTYPPQKSNCQPKLKLPI
jgi:hypothetical protein